jgi:hypothetical protein
VVKFNFKDLAWQLWSHLKEESRYMHESILVGFKVVKFNFKDLAWQLWSRLKEESRLMHERLLSNPLKRNFS